MRSVAVVVALATLMAAVIGAEVCDDQVKEFSVGATKLTVHSSFFTTYGYTRGNVQKQVSTCIAKDDFMSSDNDPKRSIDTWVTDTALIAKYCKLPSTIDPIAERISVVQLVISKHYIFDDRVTGVPQCLSAKGLTYGKKNFWSQYGWIGAISCTFTKKAQPDWSDAERTAISVRPDRIQLHYVDDKIRALSLCEDWECVDPTELQNSLKLTHATHTFTTDSQDFWDRVCVVPTVDGSHDLTNKVSVAATLKRNGYCDGVKPNSGVTRHKIILRSSDIQRFLVAQQYSAGKLVEDKVLKDQPNGYSHHVCLGSVWGSDVPWVTAHCSGDLTPTVGVVDLLRVNYRIEPKSGSGPKPTFALRAAIEPDLRCKVEDQFSISQVSRLKGTHTSGVQFQNCYRWIRRVTECPLRYSQFQGRPGMENAPLRLGANDLMCHVEEKQNQVPAVTYMLLRSLSKDDVVYNAFWLSLEQIEKMGWWPSKWPKYRQWDSDKFLVRAVQNILSSNVEFTRTATDVDQKEEIQFAEPCSTIPGPAQTKCNEALTKVKEFADDSKIWSGDNLLISSTTFRESLKTILSHNGIMFNKCRKTHFVLSSMDTKISADQFVLQRITEIYKAASNAIFKTAGAIANVGTIAATAAAGAPCAPCGQAAQAGIELLQKMADMIFDGIVGEQNRNNALRASLATMMMSYIEPATRSTPQLSAIETLVEMLEEKKDARLLTDQAKIPARQTLLKGIYDAVEKLYDPSSGELLSDFSYFSGYVPSKNPRLLELDKAANTQNVAPVLPLDISVSVEETLTAFSKVLAITNSKVGSSSSVSPAPDPVKDKQTPSQIEDPEKKVKQMPSQIEDPEKLRVKQIEALSKISKTPSAKLFEPVLFASGKDCDKQVRLMLDVVRKLVEDVPESTIQSLQQAQDSGKVMVTVNGQNVELTNETPTPLGVNLHDCTATGFSSWSNQYIIKSMLRFMSGYAKLPNTDDLTKIQPSDIAKAIGFVGDSAQYIVKTVDSISTAQKANQVKQEANRDARILSAYKALTPKQKEVFDNPNTPQATKDELIREGDNTVQKDAKAQKTMIDSVRSNFGLLPLFRSRGRARSRSERYQVQSILEPN